MCSAKFLALALVVIGATSIGPTKSANAAAGVNCPPNGYIISHGWRYDCRSPFKVDPNRRRPSSVANPGGGNVISTGTGTSGSTHAGSGGGQHRGR
jgi:hypothetical protein